MWMPRPVIQSYVSYTPELDAMDAEFFRKFNSPEQLIVSLFTIDQRYILFDTPATFKELLDNYEYISRSLNERFALFTKKQGPIARDFVFIDQNEYSLSEKILIPKEQQAHVFMFAEVGPTFIGKTLDVFYKPPPCLLRLPLKMVNRGCTVLLAIMAIVVCLYQNM